MLNKILDKIIRVLTIAGLIYMLFCIGTEAYKNIKITNKIKEPKQCIKINNDFYCKVGEIDEQNLQR